MKKMKIYTDIVTSYLRNNNIPFSQKGAANPVFVLFEMDTVSIYCFFEFTEVAVMHWSLLSWAVPELKKTAITDLLADINTHIKDGMFYLDNQTGCVAFSRSYIQLSISTTPDCESLENFCRDVLEVMPCHHDAIWKVAFSGKKQSDEMIKKK